jgi:hypothetical protein
MAIFKAQIDKKITKAFTGRKARASAIKKMSTDLNRSKKEFLSEVESDPSSIKVTYDDKTRGYFGLTPSEDPVQNLKVSFNEKIQLNPRPTTARYKSSAIYKFNIKYPSKPEIYNDGGLSLPWTPKTWVQALQEGLGNIERFLFKPGAGRSESGYQIKNSINRSQEPTDSSYLERLRNSFYVKLKGGNK